MERRIVLSLHIVRYSALTACSQEVQCDEGYQVRGRVKSLFCQSDAQWNSVVPQCQKKCCPRRQLLLNGQVGYPCVTWCG